MTRDLEATVERLAAETMPFYRTPGLAIAVVRDGEVVLRRGFGVRDVATGEPVGPATRFAAASLTKSLTAAAVGLWVDAGRIRWDTRVREVLPEFALADPVATERCTMRDLLLHRSGLGRHDIVWSAGDRDPWSMLAALPHLVAVREFRDGCAYSNLGYLVAGLVVERLAGRPWQQEVVERLLGPAGMTGAGFAFDRPDDDAWPHVIVDEAPVRAERRTMPAPPAGGLVASVDDLARWAIALLEAERSGDAAAPTAAVVYEMTRPQVYAEPQRHPEFGDALHYGLGVWRNGYRGARQWLHTGSLVGWSAILAMLPDHRTGVAVLSNRAASPVPAVLAYAVHDAVLGLEPIDWFGRVAPLRAQALATERAEAEARDAADAAAAATARPLSDYAGTYLHPGYGTMRVAVDGEELVWSYAHWSERLRPAGADTFRLPGYADRTFPDHRLLSFAADDGGGVARVEVAFEPDLPAQPFVRMPGA
ncbi:MAG: serine hydrolase [Burkholderiales bacterium]|jgi:CubicO group peptidase (beta-lactamase class C family)